MPAPTKGARLGGSPAHEKLILANLATALFEHGRITTTHAKARRLRPVAERLITFAKRGDLHARRQVMAIIRDKSVVHELFTDIGPRFAQRSGGYTRIVKRGPRKGDQAPMAVIELVESLTVAQEAVGEAEQARGTRFAEDKGSQDKNAATATATDQTDAAKQAQDKPAKGKATQNASEETSATDQQDKSEAAAKKSAKAKKAGGEEPAATGDHNDSSLDDLMGEDSAEKDEPKKPAAKAKKSEDA